MNGDKTRQTARYKYEEPHLSQGKTYRLRIERCTYRKSHSTDHEANYHRYEFGRWVDRSESGLSRAKILKTHSHRYSIVRSRGGDQTRCGIANLPCSGTTYLKPQRPHVGPSGLVIRHLTITQAMLPTRGGFQCVCISSKRQLQLSFRPESLPLSWVLSEVPCDSSSRRLL